MSFDLHQEINQWLAFAIIGFFGLCVVIYFLVNKAEAFGNNYVASVTVIESHPAR